MSTPEPQTNAGKLVLIVEDSDDIAIIMNMTLSKHGIQNQRTANGFLALEFMEHHGAPDALILDIGLPGMNGWEVLEAIKERFPDQKIPVIVLTAFDDPTNRLIGQYQDQVFRYLTKPFDPRKLVETLREAMTPPDETD